MGDGTRVALSQGEFEELVRLVVKVVLRLTHAESGGGLPPAGAAGGADAGVSNAVGGATFAFVGQVLVEHDVRQARGSGKTRIRLDRGALVSPLAVDAAREWGITLEREV